MERSVGLSPPEIQKCELHDRSKFSYSGRVMIFLWQSGNLDDIYPRHSVIGGLLGRCTVSKYTTCQLDVNTGFWHPHLSTPINQVSAFLQSRRQHHGTMSMSGLLVRLEPPEYYRRQSEGQASAKRDWRAPSRSREPSIYSFGSVNNISG